jgi:hypothetical protein
MKQQLMLVAMLSVGTALTTMGRIKPVAASLTPPAIYDYSYTWNATASEQYLNVNGVDSIPLYTRTVDGIHFNYSSTFNVVDGLSVTQGFARSNSLWQSSGMFYKPDENRIGSDATVGTIAKLTLVFDNQSNKDFFLYLDFSSTGIANKIYNFFYDSRPGLSFRHYPLNNTYLHLLIPSNTKLTYRSELSNANEYFDAWYIQDLGISQAYQQGLDAESPGILTDYLGTDAQQIGWVLIGIAAILFAFKGGK